MIEISKKDYVAFDLKIIAAASCQLKANKEQKTKGEDKIRSNLTKWKYVAKWNTFYV